jgi:rare lipoprotein A
MFSIINKNKFKIFAGFSFLLISILGNTQAKFADIDVTHPYYHAIDYLQYSNVVEGYKEAYGLNSFRALQPVNRAEAVKILMLASEKNIPNSREKIFDDVNGSDWFYNYVNAAVKEKIVKGFEDGKFHPNAQVTRAEMVKMALIAFGVPEEEFQATENEQWFEPYFNFARSFRIISGADNDYQSINRGEVAEIIYRIQNVAESGFTKKYTYSGSGKASYYNEGFAGNTTANGESYDPNDLTAAHRTLPFGTRVKVKYDNKFVIVRINDRGPYHEDRIMDLSEKAFSLLAPTSKGVIDINFEVYTNPYDEKPEIPDFIREKLSEKVQNPPVPKEVSQMVAKLRGTAKPLKRKKLTTKTQVIFPNESVSNLPKTFFKTIELRKPFPQKYLQGSVVNFSGQVSEFGHKKVTVFLQEILDGKTKSKEQKTFSGKISGKNFSFPIIFEKAGNFFIGAVIDDETRSKRETIEVSEKKDYRKFAASENIFTNDFSVRVLPEEETVFFDFTGGESTDLQKLIFYQKGLKQKILYISGGIKTLSLPYDFFAEFEDFRTLSIDFFTAESKDGTLDTQISSWKKSSFKNFQIESAFPDTEDDRISITNFTRYFKKLEKTTFQGEKLDPNLKLHNKVYITLPTGKIITQNITFIGNKFSFELNPLYLGRYIIEITSDTGEILFNRAIYFSREIILPILKEEMVSVTGESTANVRFWINSIRKNAGQDSLLSNYKLDKFAQSYADKMAHENFISHISPTGMSFGDRVKQSGLQGEFGENLSFGTTLNLALQGLKNSASHYKNMTNSHWKKVGIGLKKTSKGWYVSNIFGR